jgi:hypothetical protein
MFHDLNSSLVAGDDNDGGEALAEGENRPVLCGPFLEFAKKARGY